MKNGFYPKLAFTSMKKNKRLYLPYLLTCIGMIMMQYIIKFLSLTPVFNNMPGAYSLQMTLNFGSWVIAVFSTIFLFYTNSFLMRRRKKEFGLYNILGMDKFNIGRVLFWETLLTVLISLVVGLGLGIALSKMAELCLVNVMKGNITYTISVSLEALVYTLVVFCAIFILILINSLVRIKLSNPISLLNSESYGEKQPKGNMALGVIGLVLLAVAYYMAVSIRDPLSAMILFFVAVILVILGTYLLFIAGSVVLCRLLQKNKKYYYNPKHFVSVSSMAYRMKRNGAGLASICILGTMVLVMISSTSCLYFGSEDSLNNRYPRDINAEVSFSDIAGIRDANIQVLRNTAEEVADRNGVDEKDVIEYRYVSFTGMVTDGGKVRLAVDSESSFNAGGYDDMYQFFVIPLEDYNKVMGKNEKLEKGQAIICGNRDDYDYDQIAFDGESKLEIMKTADFVGNNNSAAHVFPSLFVITDDFEDYTKPLIKMTEYHSIKWNYGYNTDLSDEKEIGLKNELKNELNEAYTGMNKEDNSVYCESLAENREDFYGTFGGLFFLGIMLSIVFIFAAVLIMYYKQISEGYEDQSRFDIMQKVGMTRRDIRKSINSQLLTVFFLPLCMAGLHLAFAFPLIRKMLILFNLFDVKLLICTTVVSFLIFAVFYMMVYRITSNAYYKIVAGKKQTD